MDKPKNQRPIKDGTQGTRTRRSTQASHMRQGATRNASPRNANARNKRPAQSRRNAAPPAKRKSHTGLIVGSVMSVLIVAFVVMVALGIGPVGSAIRGSVAGMFGKGTSSSEAQVQTTNGTNDAKSGANASTNDGADDTTTKDTKNSDSDSKTTTDERLDTLVLVNKEYALPDGWEDKLELKGDTNIKGDYIEVDKIAYDAFVALQQDLEENEGITIQLNSGYRSVAEQQSIWDNFMADYGEEYVLRYVAEPGHSEHHTGIALDALLVEDGEPIVTNDDIFAHQDTWDVIHSYLAKHGFILRYLDGMQAITGYTYEPWHIRYVGKEAAEEIMDKGITLEEYLNKMPETSMYPYDD